MNYTNLTQNIEAICAMNFSDEQLALFVQQTEQNIYNYVQIPALRKNVTGLLTIDSKYLTVPSDFLWSYSIAIETATDTWAFLINKDVNFMREAYPNSSVTGVPKHYAYFDATNFILAPTPSVAYSVELHYGYYPESIVTAGNTWLGDEFDSALLNGALVEAIRFMKGEEDMVVMYDKLFSQSMALLKQLGDGKLREDAYRSGQPRVPVK